MIFIRMVTAYKVSGDDKYVVKAAELLKVFFVDAKTRMNPHLAYTQAIPGRHNGSKTGVIDGLHLVEIPVAIKTLEKSKAFDAELAKSLHTWFDELHTWLLTHQHGIDEGMSNNNHAVAYFLQVAVLSDFVGDKEALAKCRTKFKDVFINVQMAADGSFPRETARTKPYAYSIF
ncbi:alginate lyase, partial [bacterium]|nr:alginate lyase [bacterium]